MQGCTPERRTKFQREATTRDSKRGQSGNTIILCTPPLKFLDPPLQFHSYSYPIQIWRLVFERFLVLLEYLHPGFPNRTAVLQAWAHQSFISNFFTSCGQDYHHRNQRFLLAWVQILPTCLFIPSQISCNCYSEALFPPLTYFVLFLVSCIIFNSTGWNFIPRFLAQQTKRSISFWSFKDTRNFFTVLYNR